MMRLFLDLGNTRLKWGLHDGNHWLSRSFMSYEQPEPLQRIFDQCALHEILGVRVGPLAHLEYIEQLCVDNHQPVPQWFGAGVYSKNGVVNNYFDPTSLGPDRWFSLIAVRAQMLDKPCLVVSCGTATTIDVLLPNGCFPGGIILPGFGLMEHSLKTRIRQLDVPSGQHGDDWPKNTSDALTTGILYAQVGAMKQTQTLLEQEMVTKMSGILTGGGASRVRPFLDECWTVYPFLVLQGLLEDRVL